MPKIKNYGLVEVEKANGAVKVQIQFDNNLWWEGFILKTDGTPNKKTIKTLYTCGYRGTDLSILAKGPEGKALNVYKEFDLTTITEEVNGKEYTKIDWINDPDEPAPTTKFSKAVDNKKIGGAALGKLLNEMNSEYGTGLKNHAPSFDESEEIPF